MKNGYDKIDDVFRKPLENMQSTPPDDIFEKAFEKSGVGSKTVTGTSSGLSTTILIISGIAVITAALLFWPTENKTQVADPLMQNSNNNYSLADNYIPNNFITPANSNTTEPNSKETTTQIQQTSSAKPIHSNSAIVKTEPSTEKITETPTIETPALKNEKSTNTIPEIANMKEESSSVKPIEDFSGSSTNNVSLSESITATTIQTSSLIEPYNINRMQSLKYSGNSGVSINPDFADFVKPDTLKLKFNHWAVEISASAHVLNTNIKALNSEKQDFVNSRTDALEPGLSFFNTGVLLTYQYHNINLSGGVSYTSFKENTNYGMALTNPTSSYTLTYNGTPYSFNSGDNYYLVDTTQYWHYTYIADSTIHIVDSVQKLDFDTSLVSVFDTVPFTLYDTTDLSKLSAKYSLVEFPLWAGIEINKGNWGYSVNAGIIPGILYRRNGSYYNGTQEVLLSDEAFPVQKFVLSGGLKVLFHYYPQPRLMLFAGPEFKSSLISSTNKSSEISQKWTSWGINGGLRFFFR